MKKLSFKLGILFVIFILLIESMLFFFLYISITSERVNSETNNLLSRGKNHRDILEENFNENTIGHVALMESAAETMVVITDDNFSVIQASNEINRDMQTLMNRAKNMSFTHHGVLIETRWDTQPYLATATPIEINNSTKGYVFMFLGTESIRKMITDLTILFLVTGGATVLFSIITITFLSRFITHPIMQMKVATDKLNEGLHDVKLDIYREDELGELAQSIQKLSNDLEHLKKTRSEFLSSISHELRTPLTYLKGYADILKRPNLSEDDKQKYITIIQEEANHLTTLVKDLFILAKVDDNEFSIRKEPINLCQYLKEIIGRFQPAFHEKVIELNLECNDNLQVEIDPIRFRQVIDNLIDNAWKYSSSHSSVTVSVVEGHKVIVLKITDQGEGIPAKDIPFIWDRLFRIEKSRSRSYGGSGLGLSIVKEIVEKHGGTVHVVSKIGKGSTFTIKIPK
ncbi:HAMP domain-containing sensor histidine kinase [Bacillaceae bacterium S4-13-56]